MQSLLGSEDWEKIAALEEKRQLMAHQILDGHEPFPSSSKEALILQQIIDLDTDIQEILLQEKNKTGDELIELNRSRNKAKAYQVK